MNWGKGIAIFLVSFIIFISTLAAILMSASADLESEDYYLKEIKFSEEITAQQNAKNEQLSLSSQFDKDGLLLKINGEQTIDQAKVKLVRPDDPSKDILKSFKGNMVFVPMNDLNNGLYKVTVEWENEKTYQLREDIWVK
jgi:hypothetical protein